MALSAGGEGVYSITATMYNSSGGSITATPVSNIVVDTTPPVVSIVSLLVISLIVLNIELKIYMKMSEHSLTYLMI